MQSLIRSLSRILPSKWPTSITNSSVHWSASMDSPRSLFSSFWSIFFSSRELLLQGWMKPGRDDLAPNVALVSRRFNEVHQRRLLVHQSFLMAFCSRCAVWSSRRFFLNRRWTAVFNASRNGVRKVLRVLRIISDISLLGTVADICRYLRNFNGVLQIMAAFVNSSIFRLKQTWDRISKQNKQVINKLQSLVHSDGKFKNLRDTLTK